MKLIEVATESLPPDINTNVCAAMNSSVNTSVWKTNMVYCLKLKINKWYHDYEWDKTNSELVYLQIVMLIISNDIKFCNMCAFHTE